MQEKSVARRGSAGTKVGETHKPSALRQRRQVHCTRPTACLTSAGTCNEATGSCDCVLGYIGPGCRHLAVPSCRTPAGNLLPYDTVYGPCPCRWEWVQLMARSPVQS